MERYLVINSQNRKKKISKLNGYKLDQMTLLTGKLTMGGKINYKIMLFLSSHTSESIVFNYGHIILWHKE